MIKFFRKIRKQLLIDNKFSKYVIYAIGEIILVVIGILIALWLNNLNFKKQQRIDEVNILKGLKKDFQADIHDFKINISGYEKISSSAEYLLKELESSADYKDSLDSYFAGTMDWPISVIHNNSFDVLKSKGLDLISNDSLRNEILNFPGEVFTFVKDWETQFNRDMYFEESMKRFDKIEPLYFDETGKIRPGLMKPINYNALKTDTLYMSILRTMKRDADALLNSAYLTIIEDLERLIIKIDKELENLE